MNLLPCTCTETTVCDSCASQQIEATTPADCVELAPGVLNVEEHREFQAAIASWLTTLGGVHV